MCFSYIIMQRFGSLFKYLIVIEYEDALRNISDKKQIKSTNDLCAGLVDFFIKTETDFYWMKIKYKYKYIYK